MTDRPRRPTRPIATSLRWRVLSFALYVLMTVTMGLLAAAEMARSQARYGGQLTPLPSLPLLMAALLPALLTVVLVSILGSLIAGRLVGFPFDFLTIGFLRIVKTPGGIRVSLNENRGFGPGAVWCVPQPGNDALRRAARYLMGGLIATGLLGLVSLLLIVSQQIRGELSFFPLRMTHPFAATWLFECACFAFANLLLSLTGGSLTTGMKVAQLRKGGPAAERMLAHSVLFSDAREGKRPRDWDETWVQACLVLPDATAADAGVSYLAYFWAIDRGEIDQAGIYLERAYVSAGKIDRLLMPFLVEAAFFEARFRGNLQLAQELLQRANLRQHVGEADLLRSMAAIEYAQGHQDKAADTAREALRVMDRNPSLMPGIAILEREWLADLANPK